MADCMAFPKTADEFIQQYKFTDTKQEYTNGAELISVFRVKQMLEHYFATDNNVGGKWIPVTERLPQVREVSWDDLLYLESDLVLGFGGDGIAVVKRTREVGTDRWLWIDIDGDAWPVTHWMPLPEPPKGD